MAQISKITKAWFSYFKSETNPIAFKRMATCKGCEFAVVGTYEKFMPDESLKEIQGLKCDKCKCPLSTKLRSKNEKCPLGKW